MKTLTVRSADGRAIGIYRVIDRNGDPIAAFRDEIRVVSSRADARGLNGELLCMARLCRVERLAADGRWHECSLPEHIVTVRSAEATRCDSCDSSGCTVGSHSWLGSDVNEFDKSALVATTVVDELLQEHLPKAPNHG